MTQQHGQGVYGWDGEGCVEGIVVKRGDECRELVHPAEDVGIERPFGICGSAVCGIGHKVEYSRKSLLLGPKIGDN
ncbi:hypothetical protein JCM7447_21310 [Corynebacterium amycolatum]